MSDKDIKEEILSADELLQALVDMTGSRPYEDSLKIIQSRDILILKKGYYYGIELTQLPMDEDLINEVFKRS